MINRVVLVGRLTRDPELRYTPSNVPCASFTIAIDRPFNNAATGKPEADFIPIVVWRKQAENVKKFVRQGSLVGIEGRIQVRNYEDRDGIKRYVTEVIADNVIFLGSKGQDDSSMISEPNRKDQQNNNDEDDQYANVDFTSNDLPFPEI